MHPMKQFLSFLAILIVGTVLVGGPCFLLGAIVGEWTAKKARFSLENEMIVKVIARNQKFKNIEVIMYTADGSAYLAGHVASQQDRDQLRAEMKVLFGEMGQIDRLCGISVE
jgi:hypothetical protein